MFGSTYADLAAGNYSGGINYISKNNPPRVVTGLESPPPARISEYSVRPNPADEQLYISSSNNTVSTAAVISITGTEMINETFAGSALLNVAGLPSGLYILKISPPGASSDVIPFIFKLIVRH
jgi:hypothetical protein